MSVNNPFSVKCRTCLNKSVTTAEDGVCLDCCILMDGAFRHLRTLIDARIKAGSCHLSRISLEEARALYQRLEV